MSFKGFRYFCMCKTKFLWCQEFCACIYIVLWNIYEILCLCMCISANVLWFRYCCFPHHFYTFLPCFSFLCFMLNNPFFCVFYLLFFYKLWLCWLRPGFMMITFGKGGRGRVEGENGKLYPYINIWERACTMDRAQYSFVVHVFIVCCGIFVFSSIK